ncbi:hypothetical protein MRX96_056385 [Rhipicephalus microplus]
MVVRATQEAVQYDMPQGGQISREAIKQRLTTCRGNPFAVDFAALMIAAKQPYASSSNDALSPSDSSPNSRFK